MRKLSRREFINDIAIKGAAISLPLMFGGVATSCTSLLKATLSSEQIDEVVFTDNRGRRIVYVSRCLLNQNVRTGGIAVRKGAFTEFIDILLDNGVGIEQLPCPECILWGGVSRNNFNEMQPIVFNAVGKKRYPVIEFFANIYLWNTKNGCKKEAIRVVDRMEDFTREGYEIVGVVGVNDSPTCGVTKTLDLLDIAKNQEALGISFEDLKYPNLERYKHIIQAVQTDGSGFFLGSIMEELKKRNMDIKAIGFEPWSEHKEEAERIAGFFNLKF